MGLGLLSTLGKGELTLVLFWFRVQECLAAAGKGALFRMLKTQEVIHPLGRIAHSACESGLGFTQVLLASNMLDRFSSTGSLQNCMDGCQGEYGDSLLLTGPLSLQYSGLYW